MDFRGLIFDCDGTLVDSMPLHYRAWQKVCRRHRFSFPEHRFYSLGGVPSRSIVDLLGAEQALALDATLIAREKDDEYLALMPHAQLNDDVMHVVRSHHGHLPMAVASGGSRRATLGVLDQLCVSGLFQAVVTSEEVTRQKPAPDIFLEAARRIGIAPQHCRAFEDTDLGITAIRAAGMHAVDVRQMKRDARAAFVACS
jgi:HAD superfamily hydrolase (TIGR01509 family)